MDAANLTPVMRFAGATPGTEIKNSMGLRIFKVSRECALARSVASITAEMSKRFPSEDSLVLEAVSTAGVEDTGDLISPQRARR